MLASDLRPIRKSFAEIASGRIKLLLVGFAQEGRHEGMTSPFGVMALTDVY